MGGRDIGQLGCGTLLPFCCCLVCLFSPHTPFLLASGSEYGTVVLWDVERRCLYQQLSMDGYGFACSLTFCSWNALFLVGGSFSNLMLLWEIEAPKSRLYGQRRTAMCAASKHATANLMEPNTRAARDCEDCWPEACCQTGTSPTLRNFPQSAPLACRASEPATLMGSARGLE